MSVETFQGRRVKWNLYGGTWLECYGRKAPDGEPGWFVAEQGSALDKRLWMGESAVTIQGHIDGAGDIFWLSEYVTMSQARLVLAALAAENRLPAELRRVLGFPPLSTDALPGSPEAA